MARPVTREGTANGQFRLRVPASLAPLARGKVCVVELPAVGSKPAHTATVSIAGEIKLSLKTADRDEVRARHAAASAQVHAFLAALRAGPASLSHRQVIALSGEVYRLYTERFLEEPGSPEEWAAFKALTRATKEGRIEAAPTLGPRGDINGATVAQAAALFGANLTAGIDALPTSGSVAALEQRFGLLASWVLSRHKLVTDEGSRTSLLRAVAEAALDAGWALKRAASGDYTPDPKALRFPAFKSSKETISLDTLFARWETETKPSGSTLATWRGVVRNFGSQLRSRAKDIQSITPEDVIAFKDAELARGLAAKTVRESYIAALKTIFAFAVANRLLTSNPATGVRVAGRAQGGGKLPYADSEVAQLLKLARLETLPYRRWLPILLATTGARVGELVQLYGSRIGSEDGIPVLKIAAAEDGGTLKNEGSERAVPLHPALIAEGFLDFVETKGNGPLFYRRSSGRSTTRHASKGTSNHFAAWVREQEGFDDPRKSPAHAFRHWFKTAASRIDMPDSVADALQGHAPTGVAGRYRHFDTRRLSGWLSKLPIPGTPISG